MTTLEIMWERVRKYGLQYHDLPTMVWIVNSMLRLLALNVDPRNEKPVSIFAYMTLIVFSACYYYVYLISMAWFVFVRCRETGDLLSAIIVFSLGLSSEISMTKLICLFINRKAIRKIVSSYLKSDADIHPTSRFAANLKKTLRKVKKRALIVWNVIIWNGIIYIAKALMMPGRHFMEDVFVFYGLEPMTASPNYEIAFTINMVGVFITCYPAANVTALFIIIAGYTEAQMLALSEELTHLWDDALRHYRQNTQRDMSCGVNAARDITIADRIRLHTEDEIINIGLDKDKAKTVNKYIRKRLEELIKSHTTNITLLHQIEDVFRGAIAIEFMLLIMGIIAELLGGLENTWIELPFALMMVGSDCLTGQNVKDASVVFEKAVYDSKWENFDVTNRKMVLLMLQNSQKNMKLSAGGVATLSLECLMAVLRTTYSAYTTLRSTMK